MCWNQYVSLNTFVFSTFVLLLMIYNDKYTPYKLNHTNGIYFYFFVLSFSLMQLIEYFIWKNINNKEKVRTISIYGQLLVLLQPIASLLMLKDLLLKWVMIILYSIPASILFVSSNKKNYKTTVLNGHLKWNWMPVSYLMYGLWLFFLMFSFVINGYYKYIIAAVFLFLITYWSNYNNGTAGSLWCWTINFFMIFFAIYLLLILPFKEHGIC
jgi:hypothetical protein